MPIVNEMYKVIFENGEIKNAIANLMSRDKKHENEELINIRIV